MMNDNFDNLLLKTSIPTDWLYNIQPVWPDISNNKLLGFKNVEYSLTKMIFWRISMIIKNIETH